ncbi:MAG: trypsin-like peptidase domain-containing protein [Smithellaceae bacterium]|jgi:hypothetical protein
MFVEAIKKVSEFTRPIHTITREYGSDFVLPGAATMFFVNELGVAVTCKHVAEIIAQANTVNNQYSLFKKEKESLPASNKFKRKLKELEQKYKYKNDITIQIKNTFVNCVDKFDSFRIDTHPIYDLAVIKFNGYVNLSYKNYAVFLKDENQIQQGRYLCRLGYPFPEFSNYKYNSELDDIEWTSEGQLGTPRFPLDGIITRRLLDKGKDVGIELSTPGLKGQSGGPLFDTNGNIYGMQSMTHHLHLGFDIKDKEIFEGSKKKGVESPVFTPW